MLRILADENFNNDVVRALQRQFASIDIVRVQDVGLIGASDPEILAWAADQERIVLTHDVQTMAHYAYERVRTGQRMPGVFEVSLDIPIGIVIQNLFLIADYSLEGEWENRVIYLPIR